MDVKKWIQNKTTEVFRRKITEDYTTKKLLRNLRKKGKFFQILLP